LLLFLQKKKNPSFLKKRSKKLLSCSLADRLVATFTIRQAEEVDLLLRGAARTEIMPRFRKLSGTEIRMKTGPLDLVTDADEAAEAMITQGLRRLFPGCLVVGEEAASRNPALLGQLADAELAFVVDPVDGTSNYAAGLPLFGTMAAAVIRGEVAAAVIHDPVLDTSSLAVRGEGAWEHGTEPVRTELHVAAAVSVSRMTGAASWRYLPRPLRDIALPNLARVAQIWDFRCAAHEYRMLAAGHCHFLMFHRLMPWDHLPGWLLHREAGGYAARFDGSAYVPGLVEGGLICAPDRESWQALREALLQ
jgi:fructose-1,6-bisphosphatase/inositol monophosphatase family enzyme